MHHAHGSLHSEMAFYKLSFHDVWWGFTDMRSRSLERSILRIDRLMAGYLTSVNGYTGTVGINCSAPTPPTGVKLPFCGSVVAFQPYTLTANQVVTGSIGFVNAIPLHHGIEDQIGIKSGTGRGWIGFQPHPGGGRV